MGSFPPPSATDIVHGPDDAPFLKPRRRRSRGLLWTALALTAVVAIVLGVVLFADRIDDGSGTTASSRTTSNTSAPTESTNGSPGSTVAGSTESTDAGAAPRSAAPAVSTNAPATTTAPPSGGSSPSTAPPSVASAVPLPGIDLSDLVISRVIVSPGKSGGYPVDGAIPVLPGVVPTYPSSTDYVCIFWNVTGMPNNVPNGIVWTRDGRVVRSLDDTTFRWDKGSTVRPNWCVPSRPTGLDDGHHRVEYFVAGVREFVVEFVIGG
ncbi:MAG: hypothetical protein AB7Q42_05810 [Acidimicrobiia bacterium]